MIIVLIRLNPIIYQFFVYNCLKSIKFDEIIQNKENENLVDENQKKDFFFNLPKLSTNDYSNRFKVNDNNLIYLILTDKIMFFYKKILDIIKNTNNNHGQYIRGTFLI